MKSLTIRGVILLVVVLSIAAPVFASTSMVAEGHSVDAQWIPTEDGLLVVADFQGTLDGELRHIIADGRASKASFVGCVDGRCGELKMMLVTQKGSPPFSPGHQGKWVILNGTGDLEALRGQGTFVITGDFPNLRLDYVGSYHFDPNVSP